VSTGPLAHWAGRPWLATLLRLVAQALPIALSVAVVYTASSLVLAPAGSTPRFVAWWATLSALATLVYVVAGRVSRRLLPLAALLKLSLVFPDSAPSRFRLAFRSGTVSSLEERLAEARRGADADTPAEAAERLLALVALLDTHDALTRGHSERVRAYSQSIGRELGLSRTELELLNWAALLHDVGKLDVPREILAKRGRPTDEEWEAIREHPAAGARLAAPLRAWLGTWGDAIEQHHERWDGLGYPRALAGSEISLAGRIVAVADVFDVITSSRTYKEPSSPAAARREITRCAGTQFDPEVVRAFLAISVRRGRLAGALAWIANASVLVRLPSQAASTLSAGAVAVGAAGLATQLEPTDTARRARADVAPVSLPISQSGSPPARARPRPQPVLTRAATPSIARPARIAPTRRRGSVVRPEAPPVPADDPGALAPTPASPPLQAVAPSTGSDGAQPASAVYGAVPAPPRAAPPTVPAPPSPPEPPSLPDPPGLPEPPRLPELVRVPELPKLPELPVVPPSLPQPPSALQPPSPPALPALPSVSEPPALPAPLPPLPAPPEVPQLPLLGD
jgi:putative nucleotidyltransferase with HDIG domain